jgi:hypothetical protein
MMGVQAASAQLFYDFWTTSFPIIYCAALTGISTSKVSVRL